MKQKIFEIAKKGNHTKIKFVIAIIMALVIAAILVCSRQTIVWDRIPILGGAIFFLLLHLVYPLKQMYEWIYKNRFCIAIVAFIIIVIMGYSGSSIGSYHKVVQGEEQKLEYMPILGRARSIRSDEWVVNTPIFLSQAISKDNQFGYINDNLRGTNTDMFSVVNPPVKDILTLAKPFNIGYFFLGAERGLSFSWYGKIIALMVVAFEFCMLVTKKKLVSLCGMLLLVFSAAIQWWNSTEFLLWGLLALLCIDKFMLAKNIKSKILCAAGVFISGVSFIFLFYPAWQISYGYIYLGLLIWIFLKNKKQYKFNWKDTLIVLLVIVAIGGMCFRYITKSQDALQAVMNTDYPGSRLEIGGEGEKPLFSYVYSHLLPYKHVNNPSEVSGILSFYPIPMILAIVFLIQNRKTKQGRAYLIPLLVISIIYSVFTLMQTNEIFAKLTLLYMVPGNRLAIPLGITQVLLLIYLLANQKEKKYTWKTRIICMILAIGVTIPISYIGFQTAPEEMVFSFWGPLSVGLICIGMYLLFTMKEKISKNLLIAYLIGLALVTGVYVNPIQKGISVLTEKPIAQEVRKIVDENPDKNLWIVNQLNHVSFYYSNYFLVNGAKVVNSTQIYPNKELFETVLEEKAQEEEIRKMYNRYAHLTIIVTEDESHLKMIYEDSLVLYMNKDKLKELGIHYIVSTTDLTKMSDENIAFDLLYAEHGMFIFEVK